MLGISLMGKINNLTFNKVEEVIETITIDFDVVSEILKIIIIPSFSEINENALLLSLKNCKKEIITISNVYTKEEGEHILYWYCYESSFINALNFN